MITSHRTTSSLKQWFAHARTGYTYCAVCAFEREPDLREDLHGRVYEPCDPPEERCDGCGATRSEVEFDAVATVEHVPCKLF